MKGMVMFCLLIFTGCAKAQFSVRLVVTDVATRNQDDIYVFGNFNNWNLKDENYKLTPFGASRFSKNGQTAFRESQSKCT